MIRHDGDYVLGLRERLEHWLAREEQMMRSAGMTESEAASYIQTLLCGILAKRIQELYPRAVWSAAVDRARRSITNMLGMPPARVGYWRDETTGVLRPAIEAYLTTDDELSPENIAALRAYFRQWINAPEWDGRDIGLLRATVGSLASRQDISRWLDVAMRAGIDPL